MSRSTDTAPDIPNLSGGPSESLRILPEGIQIDPYVPAIETNGSVRSNSRPRSKTYTPTPYSPSIDKKKRYMTITQSKHELQAWIEKLLDMAFEYPFFEQLKRSTVLCELLNAIKAATCCKYQKSDRVYIQKQNISIYISGCRALGVHKNYCFLPNDLVSGYQLRSTQRKIINNLHHVARIANKIQLETKQIELIHDVFDVIDIKENDDMLIELVDTPSPRRKKVMKFKLKDYSRSRSISLGSTMSDISSTKSPCSDTGTAQHLSIHNHLDTQSMFKKELVLSGYLRKYNNIRSSIVKIICLFVIGDVASVYWTLHSQDIEDFLEEEEDILQYNKQIKLGNGSILIDVGISHNDDIVTFSINNVNKVKLIAYCYCKCINDNRVIKTVYNAMKGVYTLDIDLMDISFWQKQNALAFEKAFLESNVNTKKSARYFRIPQFNEILKLMFHIEIVSVYNNVNMNTRSEYKWHCVDGPIQDDLYDDFEICSNNFGDDVIEYDKCWTLCAKYSDFYEKFYFALKLLKLPLKIKTLTVKCCLTVDGEQYHRTEQMDLSNNCCEWDKPRIDPKCIQQQTVSIVIEIIQATDNAFNLIRKSDWKSYGIK